MKKSLAMPFQNGGGKQPRQNCLREGRFQVRGVWDDLDGYTVRRALLGSGRKTDGLDSASMSIVVYRDLARAET